MEGKKESRGAWNTALTFVRRTQTRDVTGHVYYYNTLLQRLPSRTPLELSWRDPRSILVNFRAACILDSTRKLPGTGLHTKVCKLAHNRSPSGKKKKKSVSHTYMVSLCQLLYCETPIAPVLSTPWKFLLSPLSSDPLVRSLAGFHAYTVTEHTARESARIPFWALIRAQKRGGARGGSVHDRGPATTDRGSFQWRRCCCWWWEESDPPPPAQTARMWVTPTFDLACKLSWRA